MRPAAVRSGLVIHHSHRAASVHASGALAVRGDDVAHSIWGSDTAAPVLRRSGSRHNLTWNDYVEETRDRIAASAWRDVTVDLGTVARIPEGRPIGRGQRELIVDAAQTGRPDAQPGDPLPQPRATQVPGCDAPPGAVGSDVGSRIDEPQHLGEKDATQTNESTAEQPEGSVQPESISVSSPLDGDQDSTCPTSDASLSCT
jgi:hypothetical protein